ncbi:PREDICTED: translation initiation factor IF-3, mitochondrial [Chrysochloris asiatica]|uniref:Translation initiation factor IF-3, mitochondrial n=1 Tax=Chrysochloris asiatica TaxID=185453 RepID=A0A9B0T4D7_CHRAS|nr:PREDICTED: translation initiation factor IF-3, mitochondrial [Chrysochloris asiatica]
MATQFLKRLTLHTMKADNNCMLKMAPSLRVPFLVHAPAFCTDEGAQGARRKVAKTDTALTNIGRKISERIIHVIDEKGQDLGTMHRADVIKLMDRRELRLVKRNASVEPPQYQLMTGLQIHEERMRLREMNKAQPKTGPTLTKELTFSSGIGQHDLDTKSKQIRQWIEKKYQVQVTVRKGRNAAEPDDKMEVILQRILQTLPGIATFSSQPQAVKGGRAMMCVLRPLSPKEERQNQERQEAQARVPLTTEHGQDTQPDIEHR